MGLTGGMQRGAQSVTNWFCKSETVRPSTMTRQRLNVCLWLWFDPDWPYDSMYNGYSNTYCLAVHLFHCFTIRSKL